MLAFIRRSPLISYFVLAFVISWAGVLLVVAPEGLPGKSDRMQALFPLAYLAMLVGPTVAGLGVTYIVAGRDGLKNLRTRLFSWRVHPLWYAAALLIAPVLSLVVLLPLSLTSSEYLPALFGAQGTLTGPVSTGSVASIIMMGLMVGIGAGVFEELGWTGFAVPELRKRDQVLTTGLILGLLWGAWHLLVSFWGSGTATGAFSLALFLPTLPTAFGVLPAYRVLMVWVYERTQSLLVAMLMHASLTATTLILMPRGQGSTVGIAYGVAWTLVMWAVIAVVGLATHGQLWHPPLRRRPA